LHRLLGMQTPAEAELHFHQLQVVHFKKQTQSEHSLTFHFSLSTSSADQME